jgi:hypothetical protein
MNNNHNVFSFHWLYFIFAKQPWLTLFHAHYVISTIFGWIWQSYRNSLIACDPAKMVISGCKPSVNRIIIICIWTKFWPQLKRHTAWMKFFQHPEISSISNISRWKDIIIHHLEWSTTIYINYNNLPKLWTNHYEHKMTLQQHHNWGECLEAGPGGGTMEPSLVLLPL